MKILATDQAFPDSKPISNFSLKFIAHKLNAKLLSSNPVFHALSFFLSGFWVELYRDYQHLQKISPLSGFWRDLGF